MDKVDWLDVFMSLFFGTILLTLWTVLGVGAYMVITHGFS